MDAYLIKGQTLTDIADAVRAKTSVTSAMTPAAMAAHIRAIQTGAALDVSGVPEDIAEEAQRIAAAANARKTGNSLSFIAMTDLHEMGDGDHSDSSIVEQYRRANLNAGQAAKIVSDLVNPDFFACLGDLAWGSSGTTISRGVQAIRQAREYIADVVRDNESFVTPGNHDPLTNSYDLNQDYLDHDMLAGLIGSYRYVDFNAKKVRVICLNTAEIEGMSVTGNGNTERISGTQLQWFAEALDLSGKSDAAQWGIVILSHHPLDWGNIKPAANVLAAYENGTSYSATHNGVAVSCSFAGKNAAAVIANFHGHVHCLKVGEVSGTTVKRIAIPNACYGRNNEYGQAGNTEFGETTTYEKSDNGTGKNTSFCAVTIDLTEKIIYADCFGAGYDRIVSYGTAAVETFTVTNVLANANTSNGAATVLAGGSYSAVITAKDGYRLDTVTVTMDGVDITASVYHGGAVTIPEVTGNIVITATTVSNVTYNVTNLVVTSQEQGSTAVYNGTGYKNGYRVTEDASLGFEKAAAGYVITGWIPYTWSEENVLYIRGAAVTTADYIRFYGFNETKTAIAGDRYATGTNLSAHFTLEELESGEYYRLTPKEGIAAVQFIRISLAGSGEDLIITVNEPIVAEGGGSGGEDSGGDGGYTNLVPTAVATDGVTVFNGTGYQDGTYASIPHTGTDANFVTTGFIRLTKDVKAIYVKGATWDTSNTHSRVHVYATLGSASGLSYDYPNSTPGAFTVETLGENYYKFTPNRSAMVSEYWYCMSLKGTGANLIITHDEPIE